MVGRDIYLIQKIDYLIVEAKESTEFREHDLGKWQVSAYPDSGVVTRITAVADCTVCGMGVMVDTKPPPNGIDIGGEAVALNCKATA